jgi:undecaprenyl-diphosphatase
MNYHIFQVINGWAGRSDGVDDLMEFTATALIYAVFAAAGILGLLALRRRRIRALTLTGAALLLAFLTATLVSHLSHELRPFQGHTVTQLIAHEPGVSMPSDHATAAFPLAIAIGVFLRTWWAIALAIAAAAIGFARIWVGIHYPDDIIVALLIAAGAVLVVACADMLLRRRAVPAPAGPRP